MQILDIIFGVLSILISISLGWLIPRITWAHDIYSKLMSWRKISQIALECRSHNEELKKFFHVFEAKLKTERIDVPIIVKNIFIQNHISRKNKKIKKFTWHANINLMFMPTSQMKINRIMDVFLLYLQANQIFEKYKQKMFT